MNNGHTSLPTAAPPPRDEHGRLLPGSVPGWGASWWFHEQDYGPAEVATMSPEQRLRLLNEYFEAEGDGVGSSRAA